MVEEKRDDGIHVGDYGDQIVVTVVDPDGVAIDISDADVFEMYLEDPDRTVYKKTPIFATNGSDGVLVYITEEGLTDIAGLWQGEIYVEWTDTKEKTSTKFSFYVSKTLGQRYEEPSP
jgi:hypothetical protein